MNCCIYCGCVYCTTTPRVLYCSDFRCVPGQKFHTFYDNGTLSTSAANCSNDFPLVMVDRQFKYMSGDRNTNKKK